VQLPGGEVEGDTLEVQGSPKLMTKDRVVLFLQGNGRALVPFVGWTQGVFRVFQDEQTGSERVKDHEGNRVLGVQGGEVLKEKRFAPEATIVDNRGRSSAPGAHAGNTEDGSRSEAVAPEKPGPQGEALTLRDFLNALQRKLREKGLKGKALTSVSLEGLNAADTGSASDAAAPQAQ
jgi:hypothetical protein